MTEEKKPKIKEKKEEIKTIPKEEKTTEKFPKKEETSKKPEEKKKPIQKKPVVKKTEAVVNGTNVPVSTKYSMAICKFIKGKQIETAIKDLEEVIQEKKAVPMKGEIPHRKGKGMMSGRFPKRAAKHFIELLKSLSSNANANEIEEPIITEAIANIGQRPFGKFGRVRKKRTHLKITAKTKKKNKTKKK